jgi:hypothetical protein
MTITRFHRQVQAFLMNQMYENNKSKHSCRRTILQISNMHAVSAQQIPAIEAIFELSVGNLNNENSASRNIQFNKTQLHLISLSDIYNTGGPLSVYLATISNVSQHSQLRNIAKWDQTTC